MLWAIGRIKDSDFVPSARKLKRQQAPQQSSTCNANFHDFDKLSPNGWALKQFIFKPR